MNPNVWFFLSVSVIFGTIFIMFVIYLGHKKEMKKMELEALKGQSKAEA